jgi:hypothetical protein
VLDASASLVVSPACRAAWGNITYRFVLLLASLGLPSGWLGPVPHPLLCKEIMTVPGRLGTLDCLA